MRKQNDNNNYNLIEICVTGNNPAKAMTMNLYARTQYDFRLKKI